MSAPLEQLLPALVGDMPWEERRVFIDANSDELLSDGADGRLALIAHQYRHDPRFAERVGVIRNSLELGRHDGFDGVDRPLSHYFQGLFAEGGRYATMVAPKPPDPLPDDPYGGMLSAVALALGEARTWEQRRRIIEGYSEMALSGHLEELLRTLGFPLANTLADVLADARARGVQRACWDAPPDAFIPAREAEAGPLLTRDEGLQFSWLAYLYTPAWHRRREILSADAELLLDPDAESRLRGLWDEAATQLPDAMVGPARETFDRARSAGIDAAFSAELPPSHVMMGDALWALGAEGSGATRIHDLRRLAHFYDPGIVPWLWAEANLVLARTLKDARVNPETLPVAVEEAVLRCVDALGVLRADHDAAAWRRAQLALGSAHLNRVRGDRSAWIDAAIECFENVGRSAAKDGESAEAAHAAVELALALRVRGTGIRAENLERARAYAEGALSTLSREDDPEAYGHASLVLGQIYAELPSADEADSRSRAIAHLQDALAVLDPNSEPRMTGVAHHTLGGVYAVAGQEHHPDAMKHLEAALALLPRERSPYEWAATRHALATALFRSGQKDAETSARIREHESAALEVFDADGFPVERRRVLRELAAVDFRERQWSAAFNGFEEAIAVGRWLEEGARSDAGRLVEISDMTDVYERAAYCLVQLDRASEALPLLDAGKTRGARHLLGVGGERQEELSLQGLRAILGEDAVAVVPVITSQGSVAFVLTGRAEEPMEGVVLDLPNVTDRDLRVLLDGDPPGTGWLFVYRNWRAAYDALADADEQGLAAAEAEHDAALTRFADTIARACTRLWELLMGPLHAHLVEVGIPPGATIRILPSKWLYLLPIHAAWRRENGEIRAFVDDYTVAYAPSAWLLAGCRRHLRDAEATPARLLAAIDPTADLPHAAEEADAVKSQFSGDALVLPGASATAKRLLDELPGGTHLHFACHAEFDWYDPTASGVLLADGDVLSAREVAADLDLSGVRLVVLSACETGIVESDRLPNEYVGLAGSFLQAGAVTVVSSLWSVEDESTARLMGRFYERHMKEGATPAEALRDAQREIRSDEEFAHPFYWAPFATTGA